MQRQVKTDEYKLLEAAEAYLQTIAPQAAQLDRKPETLKKALQGLGDRSLLALKVPQRWGGSELSETSFRAFQMMMARYSGALAFLQTQHQSAGALLVNGINEELKQQYLPQMSAKPLVGVGFSHLRRRGGSPVEAKRTEGGYLLEGKVPWISGWGYFTAFIIGAELPNGEAVYGLIPFQESHDGGTIRFSAPMELMAMAATNTVSATLAGWFLPDAAVVAVKPAAAIYTSDRQNVLNQGFFALGCAQAALDILESTYQSKGLGTIKQCYDSLGHELASCRQQMFQALSKTASFEQRLRLRVGAINLAGRCTQAAVIASSGAANASCHAAGRVYREALVFSVSGQTTAVMEASLKQLCQ
ncbi:MAG: acyl-CoA dehydrogenase family protein [Cyanophyceae cyanobacterium]